MKSREERLADYFTASRELAEAMVEAGLDPDATPVCSCGRTLCRREAAGEAGHDVLGG